MNQGIVFILGPTASGKSEVALRLAQKINGEIVSCDSMHVYRGMSIGTAKSTRDERKLVQHHLIDLVSPCDEFSVFHYHLRALRAIHSIWKRGKIPIVAGGSGLYAKAILDGLAHHPGQQLNVRQHYETLCKEKGVGFLFSRLTEVDPARAQEIHPNDKRRIIRALEIWEQSKRPMAEWRQETVGLQLDDSQVAVFGLAWDRTELYARVEQRVDQMLEQGLVTEVKRLRHRNVSKTARMAIGYKELLDHFEGRLAFDAAIFETKKRTRHLVKKQMTWFRKERRIKWIPVSGKRFAKAVISEIMKQLRHKKGFLSTCQ